MAIDEEKDINVTFPENYTPELAGKAAVFHVKVDGIKEKQLPEVNEELIAELKMGDDVKTVEDLRNKLKADLQREADKKAETEAEGNKTVKSVSAGNESISYDTGSGLISKVLSDKSAQARLYADTINEYLRGTKDKNGVNLLFGGAYPFYYTEV